MIERTFQQTTSWIVRGSKYMMTFRKFAWIMSDIYIYLQTRD